MSCQSLADQVLALRASGGFGMDCRLAAIEISGTDAASFLQARLSNDVLRLQPGQGQLTCLLDRKAYILASGTLHRLEDKYILLIEQSCGQETLALLEDFRFREQVKLSLVKQAKFLRVDSSKCDLFIKAVEGDKRSTQDACAPSRERGTPVEPAKLLGAHASSVLRSEEHAIARMNLGGIDCIVIRQSSCGEPAIIIIYEGDAAAIVQQAQAMNMVEVTEPAYRIACLEAGTLGFDDDLEGLPLPETGLEEKAVSYTKGCFPGQEVLARIRTYGSPRRGVAGLIFAGQPQRQLEPKQPIEIDGAEVGCIHQAGYSPTLQKYLAIVFIQREFRVPDRQLTVNISGAPYTVTAATLPFYSSSSKAVSAAKLYQQALKEFASGSEETAIDMLRQVIELNPTMADAYESLGVVLSRHDQLDEAIGLMRQLAALDPKSVMAHANLSVFHMQKGDKDAAEEEKAIAMSMRMSELARSAAAEEAEQEERRKMKEAASERMAMFKEVLAIDPDDFLANAGLGSVMVDLERFEEAIQYLRKAIAKRPGHTVAYISLGEALEELGRLSEAIDIYKQGVVVAAQKGDGTPLKKMRRRLDALAAEARP